MTDTSRYALAFALGACGTITFAETDPWSLLSQIEVVELSSEDTQEESYSVKKTFPLALQQGKTGFKITGLAVPLTLAGEVRELMLVSDGGVCPFCGSGEHGASLQVELESPLAELEPGTMISLQGDLEMIDDPQTWQSAVLRRAVITSL